MAAVVVIPSRMAATRLPGKPLLAETGKPLIRHVWEQALRARRAERVIIATDDGRIVDAASAFGAEVALTSPEHRSGTERIAEVAASLDLGVDVVVNVQGDEPEIAPATIDRVIALLDERGSAQVATLGSPLADQRQQDDPACVKVVFDHAGRALYFSRCAIPYRRNAPETSTGAAHCTHYQHLGIYAYRRQALQQIGDLPASPLEQIEGLEQLRWLQAGWEIAVGIVEESAGGIDTPEDYRRFVERYRNR